MTGGGQPAPPRRVAVTAPRRKRAGVWSARAAAADLHAQPQLAQVYARAIIRDQLRLALGVLAALVVVLGGVPAAFALVPALRTASLFGFRLPWIILGVVAYPVLIAMAVLHVRHAERVERDFTDLLKDPEPGPAATDAPDPAVGSRAPEQGGERPGPAGESG